MIFLLIALAVVPAVALMVFFYLKDRYEPEPRGHVILAFLYGFLVLIPALFAGKGAQVLVSQEFLVLAGTRADLYRTFVMVALPEEGLKFALLAATIFRWKEFDEPFDGIVYGVALALGFATVENLYYILVHAQRADALKVAVLRGVFAVPAHALYGATMGYYMGRAKFSKETGEKVRRVLMGFGLAWVFHGAYDFLCLFVGAYWGWGLLGLLSLAMWVFVLWRIPRALEVSPFKDDRPASEQ